MKSAVTAVALALCMLVIGAEQGVSAGTPQQDLKPMLSAVRKLVHKYYPSATVGLQDETIHFEFNTRKFMIHNPGRGGSGWQDATEQSGPQPGGIDCDIELRSGAYLGAATVPQEFDKRYFTLYLAAPYSKKMDCHLYIHLKYPERTSQEFLEEFRKLTNQFEGRPGDTEKQ
jgi:hypothetical protein